MRPMCQGPRQRRRVDYDIQGEWILDERGCGKAHRGRIEFLKGLHDLLVSLASVNMSQGRLTQADFDTENP